MSPNFHVILFNEAAAGRRFVGYSDGTFLTGLPLWGNFRIADMLSWSGIDSVPHTLLPVGEPTDAGGLIEFLEEPDLGKRLLVGRTGNLLFPDWTALFVQLKKARGIVKVQVGGVPSDLYCIERGMLSDVLGRIVRERRGGEDVLSRLFGDVLFNGFERIVQTGGFSFFLRDSYEYFKENMMVTRRLGDESFVGLYTSLKSVSSANIVVGDRAVIRNSYLGNGAAVHGTVEGSVISSGVTVGKNTVIRNSVLLPSNRVGENVRVENALVLEGNDRTIEHGSLIGGSGLVSNRDYPGLLKHGLTVIGEGFNVPPRSRIGSGCLVVGKLDQGKTPIEVSDGSTLRM